MKHDNDSDSMMMIMMTVVVVVVIMVVHFFQLFYQDTQQHTCLSTLDTWRKKN